MPQLNASKAAEVKAAGLSSTTSGKFVLLPEGKWRVKLTDVSSENSRKGSPMWKWTFLAVAYLEGDGVAKNKDGEVIDFSERELRYYTTIQDNTLWDLDRVFAAFEAEPDIDTDELIGDEIIVVLDQDMITGGKSKGQLGNNITDFFRLDTDFEEIEVSGGSTDDPGF